MTPMEEKALSRAALILLLLSLFRWGFQTLGMDSAYSTPGADQGEELLAEARQVREGDEVRGRPLGQGERLDPNRATAPELDRLPGIGPSVARAMVLAREESGAFGVPEDLLEVRGVGPATLKKISPFLDLSRPPPPALPPRSSSVRGRGGARDPVGGRRPPGRGPEGGGGMVDINSADARELISLPGIGPALAGRILESRARDGPFLSPDDLLRVSGIGPATLQRLAGKIRAGR